MFLYLGKMIISKVKECFLKLKLTSKINFVVFYQGKFVTSHPVPKIPDLDFKNVVSAIYLSECKRTENSAGLE